MSGERQAKRGRGKAVSWVVTERMESQSMDEQLGLGGRGTGEYGVQGGYLDVLSALGSASSG